MPNMFLPALPFAQSLIGTQQVGPAAPAFNMGVAPPIDRLSPEVSQGFSMPSPMMMTHDEVPLDDALMKAKSKEKVGQPDRPNFFGGFFENLDQGFQSPSRMIGLGLLNQVDPRLAGLGAVGQGLGLFGGNRLF